MVIDNDDKVQVHYKPPNAFDAIKIPALLFFSYLEALYRQRAFPRPVCPIKSWYFSFREPRLGWDLKWMSNFNHEFSLFFWYSLSIVGKLPSPYIYPITIGRIKLFVHECFMVSVSSFCVPLVEVCQGVLFFSSPFVTSLPLFPCLMRRS